MNREAEAAQASCAAPGRFVQALHEGTDICGTQLCPCSIATICACI